MYDPAQVSTAAPAKIISGNFRCRKAAEAAAETDVALAWTAGIDFAGAAAPDAEESGDVVAVATFGCAAFSNVSVSVVMAWVVWNVELDW
ncbi:MAG: hypothetical protein ACAI35_01595 [Candidatus Methylacidiphilales bacterium]